MSLGFLTFCSTRAHHHRLAVSLSRCFDPIILVLRVGNIVITVFIDLSLGSEQGGGVSVLGQGPLRRLIDSLQWLALGNVYSIIGA